MPLIKCRECGRQVSDRAVSCPSCGVSVNAKIGTPMPTTSGKGKSLKGVVIALSILIVVLGGTFAFFALDGLSFLENIVNETSAPTPEDTPLASSDNPPSNIAFYPLEDIMLNLPAHLAEMCYPIPYLGNIPDFGAMFGISRIGDDRSLCGQFFFRYRFEDVSLSMIEQYSLAMQEHGFNSELWGFLHWREVGELFVRVYKYPIDDYFEIEILALYIEQARALGLYEFQ